MKKFEHRPDSGRLMATQSKLHEKSPDYWGEIAINVKDMTKVERQGDLCIFKINGWKRRSEGGSTYLSLSVDRYVEKSAARPAARPAARRTEDIEDDMPF